MSLLSRLAVLVFTGLLAACAASNAGQSQVNTLLPPPKEAMPYFWPYPNVPEPRWPQAHPDAVYREGMTAQQYFQHLCKLESGEFVYKTVQDVESIYFVRLHGYPKEGVLLNPYILEDPFGWQDSWTSMGRYIPSHSPAGKDVKDGATVKTVITETERRQYRFVEAPQPYFRGGVGIPLYKELYSEWAALPPINTGPYRSGVGGITERNYMPGISVFNNETVRTGTGTKYVRLERNPDQVIKIHRYPQNQKTFTLYSHNNWINLEYTDQITSRYGVVWRGITRPRDRELGIAGSELLVLDLRTNEILGVRRGFALGGAYNYPHVGKGRLNWRGAAACPARDLNSNWSVFIESVVQPPLVQLKPPIED